jgi:hypothetical protein
MNLELYIDGKKADVPDNFTVNFTYKETEVTKPSAIKNSFSKSVVLDGTAANNKIFSSIFRLDKIQGENDFNPNKRIDFKLMKNGDIVESGYLQLDSVTNTGGNVKYSCTLYGGLGSFFYTLQTNDDGTEKTLADLYYKFNVNGVDLTKEQEESEVLFQWNMYYMFATWLALSMVNDGSISASTTISLKDPKYHITAAPTYSGLYEEDFDSKHVLVNLNGMPSNIKQYFLSAVTSDGITYKPYLDDNSGYTMVEVSRDLSEFEARDLCSTYQRRVIRNKTILDAISDPDNNGGYTIVWDPEILDSKYYKNSYLLLDRFDTSKINNKTVLYQQVNWSGAMMRTNDVNGDIWKVNGPGSRHYYNFSGMTNPQLDFWFDLNFTHNAKYSNLYTHFKSNLNYQYQNERWSGFIYRIDAITDTLASGLTRYVSSNDYFCCTDFDSTDSRFQSGLTQVVNYLNTNYSSSEKYTYSKDKIKFKTINIVQKEEYANNNYGYFLNEGIRTTLDNLPTDVDNVKLILRIKSVNILWTRQMQGSYSNFVEKINTYFGTNIVVSNSKEKYNNSGWAIQAMFDRYNDELSSYHDSGVNPSLKYLDITKKTLFADTQSPYKYLTDFTRLFNAKYEIDNYHKTIYIKLLKNFYKDETIDINNRIDRSKEIRIKPTLANTKWCNYSLDTPETYASYLYGLKNKVKYGELSINTGYDFNTDSVNLLEDSSLKNTIPFTLSSNYFNVLKSGNNVIPTCIQQPIFKQTLYKQNFDDIKQFESDVNSTSSLLYYYGDTKKDQSYKLCCFDKENKNVSDINSALVFFSGWDVLPYNIIISDNMKEMDKLNGAPCYLYTWSTTDYANNTIATLFDAIPRFSKYYDVDESNQYVLANDAHTDYIQASMDFALPTQTFIDSNTNYDQSATIYYQFWKNYISDLYDSNNKQVSCYVFLKDKPADALKKFYYFDNSIWILNEITNYDIMGNKPTKCTFIKVKDKNNYLTN